MPAGVNSACQPNGTSGEWVYQLAFNQCNIMGSFLEVNPDTDGMDYHAYSVYLNFDHHVEGSTEGVGNVIQIGQTKIQCRIPANLQENAYIGQITVEDEQFTDEIAISKLWSKLQLDVITGGVDVLAQWNSPLTSGSTIPLTSHVKLEVNNQGGSNALSDYK